MRKRAINLWRAFFTKKVTKGIIIIAGIQGLLVYQST